VEENDYIINKENPTTIWKKEQTSNKEDPNLEKGWSVEIVGRNDT
jgi:hypothetical protein